MTKVKVLLATISIVALASCGGGNSGSAESQAQASAVTAAVTESLDGVNANLGAKLNPRTISIGGSAEIADLEVACSGGGTVTVSGSITTSGTASETSGDITMDFEFSEVFDGCKVTVEEVEYTVDGSMEVDGDGGLTYTASDSSFSFDSESSAAQSGSVSVVGGDVNVSDCDVDLSSTSELSGDGSSFSGSYSWDGTVCGAETSGSQNFSS
jgi:hypothetical protein